MIQLKNLKKAYDGTLVLDVPELNIHAGDSLGLVGNNGAGKTTMFSLILDLIRASAGEVWSKEKNVAQSEDWKQYTTSYLDESFLLSFLTPEEYFTFVGRLYGLNAIDVEEKLKDYADFFNGEILGKKKYIRDLSKGNQKKVGIVAALLGDPEVLLLDEPFSNLDPTSQIRLKNMINQLPENKTVLISSHDLNHVTEVCDRIVVLDKGVLVKDLKTNEQTLEELTAYFAVQLSPQDKNPITLQGENPTTPPIA
ncbi:MAG: ABC transporter ATP-binding protein [Bacteroidota bacterium]